MRAILLFLFCTMALVRAELLGDVMLDARMENEETDELSSDTEIFPRFIGAVDFNRKRREEHAAPDHPVQIPTQMNQRSKSVRKRKRRINKRHYKPKDEIQSNRYKRHKKKRRRVQRKEVEEQVNQSEDSYSKIKDQESSNDLTTCIIITETEEPSTPESTSVEAVSDVTTEESSSSFENTTIESSTSSKSTSTPEITTEFTTTEKMLTENLETTVNTESTESISLEKIPTTTEESNNKTSDKDDSDVKIFNVKLVCKIGKSENETNFQKVYQCYFGSSDLVSFYMPSVQKAIMTQEVGDSFPTISPEILPGNNTWRLIEAAGMRTRIIEKTENKKSQKEQITRTRRGMKHRFKKRKRFKMGNKLHKRQHLE